MNDVSLLFAASSSSSSSLGEDNSDKEKDNDSPQEEDASKLLASSLGSVSHYLDNCASVEVQFESLLNINDEPSTSNTDSHDGNDDYSNESLEQDDGSTIPVDNFLDEFEMKVFLDSLSKGELPS
jgi:hypothetical protein